MGTVPTNWSIAIGSGGATSNLGNSGILAASATSTTITGLPVDGSSATVYLYALINGVWTQLDSETSTTFTAPPPAQPEIISPLTGETLTSGSVTVNWDAMGTVPTNWSIAIGSGGATSNLGNSGILAASATSTTITGLPVDGSSATVYLYALINGVWTQLDSETITTFTAPPPAQPEIISPLTGETLTSGSVTVNWDAMGTVPTNWFIGFGSGGQVSNLGHSGVLSSSAVTATITGLPTDGSSATVYLYALINNVWVQLDTEAVTLFTTL